MTSTTLPLSACAICGADFDTASGAGHDRPPRPGDVTMCLHCGGVHRFDAKLRAVVFPDWRSALPPATVSEVERVQGAIAAVWARGEA